MLQVRLFTHDAETGELAPGDVEEVDYVSLVNNESFGKPPLIAPEDGNRGIARDGDTVLYINTSHVVAFSIKRDD